MLNSLFSDPAGLYWLAGLIIYPDGAPIFLAEYYFGPSLGMQQRGLTPLFFKGPERSRYKLG